MQNEITQPTPTEIKSARLTAGRTQTQAAQLVHASLKTWQNWESETGESRKIPLASWELFLRKTAENRELEALKLLVDAAIQLLKNPDISKSEFLNAIHVAQEIINEHEKSAMTVATQDYSYISGTKQY